MERHRYQGQEERRPSYRNRKGVAPEGTPGHAQRLEHLLSERQDLVRHLDALAPTDGTRQPLEQRLQAITDEQERLLQDLIARLPPEIRVA